MGWILQLIIECATYPVRVDRGILDVDVLLDVERHILDFPLHLRGNRLGLWPLSISRYSLMWPAAI